MWFDVHFVILQLHSSADIQIFWLGFELKCFFNTTNIQDGLSWIAPSASKADADIFQC